MCYDLNVKCFLQAYAFDHLALACGAFWILWKILDMGASLQMCICRANLEGYDYLRSDWRSLLSDQL